MEPHLEMSALAHRQIQQSFLVVTRDCQSSKCNIEPESKAVHFSKISTCNNNNDKPLPRKARQGKQGQK